MQLPPALEFVKAKILLLKLTLPLNIYKEAITIEIVGVESQLHVKSKPAKPTSNTTTSRTDHDRDPRRPSSKRSTSSRLANIHREHREYDFEEGDDLNPHIPTAEDLAQSFLLAERDEERAELEAAILSETQEVGTASILSEDEEIPVGTGTTLSLPTFMAKFLQDIVDRLEVTISGITINLDVDVPSETSKLQFPQSTDSVTVQLSVEDIEIQGVTHALAVDATEPYKEGKRLVCLSKIRGILISEANLFSSLARSSTLSSPSIVHSDFAERQGSFKTPSTVQGSVFSTFEEETSPEHSSIASSSQIPTAAFSSRAGDSQLLGSSIISSNSGRFDDAPEEDEASNMSESARLSETGDSVYQNSAYLDQVMESQHSEDGSNQGEASGLLSSRRFPSSLRPTSPLSTPRASIHLPTEVTDDHQKPSTASLQRQPPEPMLHSTILPPRQHSRFSDDRVSQSQPSLPANFEPIPYRRRANRQDDGISVLEHADIAQSNAEGEDLSTPLGEDLTQSQLFSHEDAESMYMSAISHTSSTPVPGGWVSAEESSISDSQQAPQDDELDNLEHARQSSPVANLLQHDKEAQPTPNLANSVIPDSSSSSIPSASQSQRIPSATQAPSNISERSTSSSEYARLSKHFFTLDDIKVYIPALNDDISVNSAGLAGSGSAYASSFNDQNEPAQSTSINIPGAFSTHLPPQVNPQINPIAMPKFASKEITEDEAGVEVVIGHLKIQFDISIARLVYKIVEQVKGIFKQESTVAPQKSSTPTDNKFRFGVKEISAKFLGRLDGTMNTGKAEIYTEPLSSDVLLQTSLRGLQIESQTSKSNTKTSLALQKFTFGYAQENIVFFDSDLQMGSSVRDLKASAGIDVSIIVTQTAETIRCEIITLPVHVSIDLQRLDETFSWFGGLSGVLNLGSSMASNTTVTASTPNKPKPRGVRFETPIRPDDKSVVSQNKADVRIGGFMLDLVGAECWVSAKTSAVKVVSRDEGIGVSIQKIKLSGPHLRQNNEDPAINVDITSTRLEYLSSPKDVDLERLLSLITPSKAKYDQDDDILLETLLRQRKQGAVLRLTFEDFQTSVSRLYELSHLPDLGEEVARLATVAKYLPDDERPGLLSLISVRKFGANVDFDNAIGTIQTSFSDVEVAQISLPALMAVSVGGVSVRRNISEELLGFATDPELREPRARAPAIMARMIGDEMEPVVKIKLWNLRVEYHVSTLIALLGLAENATSQDMSASITASVATLTDLARSNTPNREPHQVPNNSTLKSMKIDIVLRGCILGLNPLGLPSKMLVVLTEARSTALLPKDGNANASLDLSKASLLIVDNIAHLVAFEQNMRNRRQSFDGGSMQVADLTATGYVSVSYISSAKAIVQMTTSENQERTIDVELRDDLFVLESCADSTQTMIAVLNGLSPPTPPSKETKYRTKVIPVHDLLASLSGDAFGTAEGQYNIDDDFDIPDGDSELDLDEDYYRQGGDNQYDETILGNEGRSTLAMQVTSRDTSDGVLLNSFVEPPAPAEEPTVLDFQDDHFGTGSIIEGTAHRWNSAKNTYDRSNVHKIRKSPLKVCVRDVHIIWNLFDGYDWQSTRDVITKAVQDVESKAIEKRTRNERRPTFDQDIEDDETVIGDFLFNSIYIGIPAHREPGELLAAVNQEINDNATETESIATTSLSASPNRQGGVRRSRSKKLRLNRSKHHKITFELRGVCVDFVAFPPGTGETGETQSSIDIRVHDFEIFDHVPTSAWRKFATYMQDAGERESGASMIHIEIINVKPQPDLAASDIVLKATVLPLRLHVDQDALDFITRFFEFKDDSAPVEVSSGDPPFLQRVEVNSIQVKLDFKPKRVDYAGLRSGHTTEFMNFFILDEADMVLRHTIIYGIRGFDKLGKCLNDIWMPDIKRNQLPGILAGLAPVRSLVNVGGGLRHLVVVPMREYKKDGRIVRGISKGAAAFVRTTGTELVKLGAKVAIGVQTVLQGAEDFLGPTSENANVSIEGDDVEEENRQISLYANQPVGVLQGLKGGYAGLQRDLVLARDAIIAVPGEVMEGGNAAGVLRAVRKHAPTVILRPAIGLVKASGQVLMGATNSLDPNNLQRVDNVSAK